VEAGRRDLGEILAQLEASLGSAGFVCGEPSIADFALFPHLSSLKLLGVALDPFPKVLRWNREMRALPVVRADLESVKRALESLVPAHRRTKPRSRGAATDQWVLSHGFGAGSSGAAGRAVIRLLTGRR
jgi:hypothetical protein